MVERIMKYLAADGSEWREFAQAQRREELVDEVNAAMAGLPDIEVQSDEYYQHDREVLFDARRKLFELAKREHLQSYPAILQANADDVHPMSGVGRILSDCNGPIPQAWNRFGRICFETFREYDQPYRVSHPSTATKQLN